MRVRSIRKTKHLNTVTNFVEHVSIETLLCDTPKHTWVWLRGRFVFRVFVRLTEARNVRQREGC